MDHKRKASTATGADAEELDGPAAKRRRLPTEFDLFQGETPESTTAYGLNFLEHIRRTADKSKRPVSSYFEKLLPKEGNEDYYRRTRMPISLEMIEHKLNDGEFADLTELEAYFKRMVSNAKEYYSKNSVVFEDAERVRKAMSNYMTKTNPAYKLVPNFVCQPTPIPPELEADADEEELEADADGEAGAGAAAKPDSPSQTDVGEDAEHEDGQAEKEGEKDAEGEEEDGDDDGEDGDDAEEEDDDDDEEEEEEDSDSGARSRVQKRRSGGSGRPVGRPPKNQAPRAAHAASRYSNAGSKTDQAYIGVPYKGLNFQEAQEKIVEELVRKKDDDDEWPYFEPFLNLPPRTLKDYFSVITEPLSLKGLQKLVRGIHGRHESLGVSDFKGWAAFEEKATLLWTNAHFYNEEGSEIYNLATELKECFETELAAAKAVVQEPPQPKIKLKVPQTQDPVPPSGAKKITIHVATRGSATGSPAPPTVASAGSTNVAAAPANGTTAPARPIMTSSAPLAGLSAKSEPTDLVRSGSVSGASPSPSLAVQPEMIPKPNGVGPSPLGTPNGIPGPVPNGQPPAVPVTNGQPPTPVGIVTPLYDTKYRAPGKGLNDALIQSLIIRTHPALVNDNRKFKFELRAHPREAQQSVTINVPAAHWKMQIIPRALPTLEQQQRMYRLFVVVNGQTLTRVTPIPIADDPIPGNVPFFEANLVHGVNWISVHLIAALPKNERRPDGPDCELEKMFVVANLLKY